MLHVGPEPNVIPATFARLAVNVRQQIDGRTFGQLRQTRDDRHGPPPWLGALLPARAALLRAPFVEQIVLEDWLLAHAPK